MRLSEMLGLRRRDIDLERAVRRRCGAETIDDTQHWKIVNAVVPPGCPAS
jgi:integrase